MVTVAKNLDAPIKSMFFKKALIKFVLNFKCFILISVALFIFCFNFLWFDVL